MTTAPRALFDGQLETSIRWRTSGAGERVARLRRLRDAMMARRTEFHAAFHQDFAKPSAEVDVSELLPVLEEVRHATGSLRRWMRPRRAWPTLPMLGTSARVAPQPRGRVLIIAPWNYPLGLCFGPLVSALAAGNTVILKPSELTPAVSGLMARIVAETFPPDEVALVEGGPEVSQALLDLPFDHVFFTGSPAVGRLVAAAAARHLAGVTLELGGKCPAIVTPSADPRDAAETLMWGKLLNAGQTCVAPDHVFVHRDVRDAFVAECRKAIARRFGDAPAERRQSPDLARIVSTRHAERLAGLLTDAVERGARVLAGGETDTAGRYVEPTLLGEVPPGARIMDEEIFGPILPILEYGDLDELITAINARPKPLALYVWGRNRDETGRVLAETSSGGACVNHCVIQFAHGRLPFGGVGESGFGAAHGHYGFLAFSHQRAVLGSGRLRPDRLFFPPYAPWRRRLLGWLAGALRRLG